VPSAASTAGAGTFTAADWLAVALPRLPERLAGPQARERLLALGRVLPGDAILVLETTLASRAGARVDLSLRIASPRQALAVLAVIGGRSAGSWQRFLASWAARPAWRARVPAVWLEYDLDRSRRRGPPVPILCAQLADARLGWVRDSLLPAMRGAPLSTGQRRLLASCWREIPRGGRPLYVFALLSRRTRAMRLEIGGGPDLTAFAAFLERVRAPFSRTRVAALQPLLAGGGRLHLSLDLEDEAIGPRLGVEVSFPRQPRRDPRWRRLLGRLAAAGMCSPAARDAALAWPGQDGWWTAPGRWPVPVSGRPATGSCVRCISHVKLVCVRRRPTAAKLYLLAAHVEAGTLGARAHPSGTEPRE
jgi:hypothetical protein